MHPSQQSTVARTHSDARRNATQRTKQANRERERVATADADAAQTRLTGFFAPPVAPVTGQPVAIPLPIGTAEVIATAFDHGADRAQVRTADGAEIVITKTTNGAAVAST